MTKFLLSTALAASLMVPTLAMAHSPIFDCYDNGDGTIMCQGGFSDGSSAAGVKVNVLDGSGAAVQNLVLDANGEITIDKPAGAYSMQLDAGEGHAITVDGKNIVE